MFNTTLYLSDKEKILHDLISPYLTDLGVVDLGNHFKAFNSDILNSIDFVNFLKAECVKYKDENITNQPKIYCYLDENYIAEIDKEAYSPTLIFIDKNYIVNIDRERRVSIYDHHMERKLQYKVSLDSFDVNFISIFPVNFYARKTRDIVAFSMGKKTFGQDTKNPKRYFLQDDNSFTHNFNFERDQFSLNVSNSGYSHIIFDYNMNIREIGLSDIVFKDLHVSKITNVINYEDLIEQLEPNFEIFFLENDCKYTFPTNKDIFNEDLLLVKKIINHEENLKKLFAELNETINLKDQQKPISEKTELLKFYPNLISENNIVKEINEKFKINDFESKPIMNIYCSVISTLLLLQETNENLIDYTIIEKSNLIESRIKNFIKEFEDPSSNPKMKI